MTCIMSRGTHPFRASNPAQAVHPASTGPVGSCRRILSLILVAGCLPVLCLSGNVRAQDRAEVELTLLNGQPVGELARGIDGAAWGGALSARWILRGTAISIGGRVGVTTYGSEFSHDLPGYTAVNPEYMKFSYDLLTTHVVIRFQPRLARLTPYVETFAGINYFFTQAYTGENTTAPIFVNGTMIMVTEDESKTLIENAAPSYGLGAGLKMRLLRFGQGKKATGNPLTLFFDLQGRYLFGGRVKYLAPGSLSFDGDRLVLTDRYTRSDLLFLSAGISLRGAFRER